MTIHPDKDPLGRALIDYLNGKHADNITIKSSITEDDVIPVNYLFRDFSQMPKIEQKALLLCDGKLLDVGAGSGSHSLYLQKKSFDVTGLDISENACNCCKQRGVKVIANNDFFSFSPSVKYDTLLMMMNGIGFTGTVANLDTFFHKAKQLLAPGGQILLDSSDIRYMFEDDEGEKIFASKDNEPYYGEVIYMMEYKGIAGNPFKWLFIDPDLLQKIAKKQGFRCKQIVTGANYDYLAQLTL